MYSRTRIYRTRWKTGISSIYRILRYKTFKELFAPYTFGANFGAHVGLTALLHGNSRKAAYSSMRGRLFFIFLRFLAWGTGYMQGRVVGEKTQCRCKQTEHLQTQLCVLVGRRQLDCFVLNVGVVFQYHTRSASWDSVRSGDVRLIFCTYDCGDYRQFRGEHPGSSFYALTKAGSSEANGDLAWWPRRRGTMGESTRWQAMVSIGYARRPPNRIVHSPKCLKIPLPGVEKPTYWGISHYSMFALSSVPAILFDIALTFPMRRC